MFNVLLATHGDLGRALLSTAGIVYGDVGEGVDAVGFVPGESPDALLAQIRERICASPAQGGCLVLCDIVGGSPFLMAAQAFRERPEGRPVAVVSGLNLGMLLEVLAVRDASDLDEARETALAAAHHSIRDLSE